MYYLSGELTVILNTYLAATRVRERLAVSKQAAEKFHVVMFNLKKINELQVRKQYQIKFSNKFADFYNLNDRGT
jgi:very-short-patch-repair endonuclease